MFGTLSTLLHVGSFFRRHGEGDEQVYLALSREMGWNLAHYSTAAVPIIKDWPSEVYRQPLFYHPPLLPLVLKVGGLLGSSIVAGLFFELGSMLTLFLFARRFARFFALDGLAQFVFYALLTACPLMLFSTTRLHHDALLGIYLFGGVVCFMEALESKAIGVAWLAGALLTAAFNLRYTALLALPILALLPVWAAWRGQWRHLGAYWGVCLIVAGWVSTLGLHHFYRIVATYGSLAPDAFVSLSDGWERFSELLSYVAQTTRLRLLVIVLSLYPFLFSWLKTETWKGYATELCCKSWRLPFVASGLWLAASVVFLTDHPQARYLAVASPFLIGTFALRIDTSRGADRSGLIFLTAVSIVSMLCAGIVGIASPMTDYVYSPINILLPMLPGAPY
jgi:4-amino-4-deoxy-L-arabinose transferase-like glycosyltransferase